MRKIALTVVLLGFAVPALAAQASPGSTKTSAEKLCRAERGTAAVTRDAFAAKYGTGKNHKNAFGKCVSAQAAALAGKSPKTIAAKVNAAKACSTERGTTDATVAAFAAKYGTNASKSNAFGKCVSATAKAKPKG
jgi:hypothetical protein